MPTVAVLSLHTSPLDQPGTGDSGGMNVYVRELVAALAQAGVPSRVYTRRTAAHLPVEVPVEPGVTVVHVDAGPPHLAKEELHATVGDFAAGVAADLAAHPDVTALHANYWLSAVAGHRLKHERSLPLAVTFHTLARVKADNGLPEARRREQAEAEVIGCADAILASCDDEARQLEQLYGAHPGRVEVVPPGVDHAFFSPGHRAGARHALGLGHHPVLLFVGRIQPLKGLTVAVEALAELPQPDAQLLVVGGPSGPDGATELAAAQRLVAAHGLGHRVRFVPPQPHHLLSTYYRAADVVVVPSRSESFGLVALEAAACGTPVVASAVGGLTTLVQHGRTGLLVEGRTPGAFASAVGAILADPAWAAELGGAAASHAAGYRWSTTAGRLRRLYADLGARQLVECR